MPYRRNSLGRIERLRRMLSALREPIVERPGVRGSCLIWEWTDLELALNLIAELHAEELHLKNSKPASD